MTQPNQARAAFSDLTEWASWVVAQSGQQPALHHRLLLQQLDAISRGTIDRLMVLMPPGSAKTTYASVNTDLWGAYVSTPSLPGNWFAWVEGSDGSKPTVHPVAFTVT
jgi:hypothetical protein